MVTFFIVFRVFSCLRCTHASSWLRRKRRWCLVASLDLGWCTYSLTVVATEKENTICFKKPFQLVIKNILTRYRLTRKVHFLTKYSYVEFGNQNKWAKEKKKERQTKKQTLNSREYWRGGGRGDGQNRWGGIKERTYTEHWVRYRPVQSLQCTPETNRTLYANSTGIGMKKLSKKGYIWLVNDFTISCKV